MKTLLTTINGGLRLANGARAIARFTDEDARDVHELVEAGSLKRGERRAPRAFTLIEVMVVVVLLSFIIIALMGVFNSTQAAFRASVTQTDVLESGRAAMDLITTDLRAMAPSMGESNNAANNYKGAANFYVTDSGSGAPLIQTLVASSGARTNLQQDVFILSKGNLNGVATWYATGYAVHLSPSNIYSLYRFSTNSPVAQSLSVSNLFWGSFNNFLAYPNSGNYSHLLDGVIGFRMRAFDANGSLIITNRMNIATNAFPNDGFIFYSNALPAAVEIEMATLEDRTLQRAESRPDDLPALPPGDSRTKYLQDQAAKVHVFRQRVAIPNVDSTVYQ